MTPEWIVSRDAPVLVTGAAGFIGTRVVDTLLEYGFGEVRCFVRPSSNLSRLKQVVESHPGAAVRIIEGNLLRQDDCAKAAADAAVVFHLAAGIDKSYAGCFMNSVLATRNLLPHRQHPNISIRESEAP